LINELEAITGGTLPRILRAGIAYEALESHREGRERRDDDEFSAGDQPNSPLQMNSNNNFINRLRC